MSIGRASGKIESKAQLCQKREFEADHVGCSAARIDEPVEHLRKTGVDLRMRVALGQEPAEGGEVRHAVERVRNG